MTDERQNLPLWADLLLTLWVLIVGVVYFGGYFVPAIGGLTANAAAFYAVMLLAAGLAVANRYLRRARAVSEEQKSTDIGTKRRK